MPVSCTVFLSGKEPAFCPFVTPFREVFIFCLEKNEFSIIIVERIIYSTMTQNNKSGKKIFGFDFDGVIADHTKIKQEVANVFGFLLKENETHSEVMKKRIPLETLRNIQHEIYDIRNNQPLVSGAMNILVKMRALGYPFSIISRRKTDVSRENAMAIMKNNGLWPEIFNEKNVFFVESPEQKNEIAKKLCVNYYVDDEMSVLEKMPGVRNRYLFDFFGNFKDEKNFERLGGWDDLEKKLL